MIIAESVMLIALLAVGIIASVSDCKTGIVPNVLILYSGIFAIIADAAYYTFFAHEFLVPFLLNTLIITAISLLLFYTHSFAGGDCKLIIVMALFYPTEKCLLYYGKYETLFFAVAFAIFFAYIYILVLSVAKLIKKPQKESFDNIRLNILQFVKSYCRAVIYISAVHLLSIIFRSLGVFLAAWVISALCILTAWITGRYSIFRNRYVLIAVLLVDTVLSFGFKTIPFSVRPENYVFVIVLMLCQTTIKTNLYDTVNVQALKPGMILSTFSSTLMYGSRFRGLPGISHEDLRDRMSSEQVEAVKRWANSRNVETVTIVKKIPFAVFILLGYTAYFLMWSFIK